MPARYRARVTDIGEFIRNRSCQRFFRLSHNNRELYRYLPFAGRPFHVIDPVLLVAGRTQEDAWAKDLQRAGCSELAGDSDDPVEWWRVTALPRSRPDAPPTSARSTPGGPKDATARTVSRDRLPRPAC